MPQETLLDSLSANAHIQRYQAQEPTPQEDLADPTVNAEPEFPFAKQQAILFLDPKLSHLVSIQDLVRNFIARFPYQAKLSQLIKHAKEREQFYQTEVFAKIAVTLLNEASARLHEHEKINLLTNPKVATLWLKTTTLNGDIAKNLLYTAVNHANLEKIPFKLRARLLLEQAFVNKLDQSQRIRLAQSNSWLLSFFLEDTKLDSLTDTQKMDLITNIKPEAPLTSKQKHAILSTIAPEKLVGSPNLDDKPLRNFFEQKSNKEQIRLLNNPNSLVNKKTDLDYRLEASLRLGCFCSFFKTYQTNQSETTIDCIWITNFLRNHGGEIETKYSAKLLPPLLRMRQFESIAELTTKHENLALAYVKLPRWNWKTPKPEMQILQDLLSHKSVAAYVQRNENLQNQLRDFTTNQHSPRLDF